MIHNHRGSPYFFSEWSSLFLLTAYQTCTFIFDLKNGRTCDIFLRNNNGKWLDGCFLRNHGQEDPENPVYLSEKKVYYVFLFLKVSQCKLKQKETILKLGSPLKSKSKFTKSKIGLGASTSTPYQGFTLNPLGAFWLLAEFSLRL